MLALLAVAAAAVLVTAGGSGSGAALTSAAELSPAGWAGLAGETRPHRVIHRGGSYYVGLVGL